MKLSTSNPEDRKLLARIKGQSGRSLLEEQELHEASLGSQVKEKKHNKYRNEKFIDGDGIKWASLWEYNCWLILRDIEKKGIIRSLKRQRIFKFVHNGIHIATARLDFSFEIEVQGNWIEIIADAKSEIISKMQRFLWQTKMMQAFYQIDILVFIKGRTDVQKEVYNLKKK